VSSERDFFCEWPESVWSLHTGLIGILDRFPLTTPTASFFIPIKGTPPSLSWVVGSWLFAYSFNGLLSSLQPLFVRSKSFVDDSSIGWRYLCVSHLSSNLEHFGLQQASVKHLLPFKVKPPKWLGVTLELPIVW
jgi:hypothetical protein